MNSHFICKSNLWEKRLGAFPYYYTYAEFESTKICISLSVFQETYFSLLSIYPDHNKVKQQQNEAAKRQPLQLLQSVIFYNTLFN